MRLPAKRYDGKLSLDGSMLNTIKRLAAYGLVSAADDFQSDPLDDTKWRTVASVVRRNRLCLVAAAAVNSGVFPVSNDQAGQVYDHEEAAVAAILGTERAALHVAELLTSVGSTGAEFLILKGAAHSQVLWADPNLRAWADLDVLVSGEHIAAVAELLVGELGATWHDRQDERESAVKFAKSMTFSLPSGVAVDLHRTLVKGPFGELVRQEDLWTSNSTISVGGQPMRGLSVEAMIIHACMHALSSELNQLTRLRDIAEGIRRDAATDVDRVMVLARHWDCEAVVASGINRAAEVFNLEPSLELVEWAASNPGSTRQERRMSYYRDQRRTDRIMLVLSRARAMTPLSLRVTYLHNVAFHKGRDPLWNRLSRLRSANKRR